MEISPEKTKVTQLVDWIQSGVVWLFSQSLALTHYAIPSSSEQEPTTRGHLGMCPHSSLLLGGWYR